MFFVIFELVLLFLLQKQRLSIQFFSFLYSKNLSAVYETKSYIKTDRKRA